LADETVAGEARLGRIYGRIEDQKQKKRHDECLAVGDQVPIGDADDLEGADAPQSPQTEVLDKNTSVGDDEA
jgi:hypothetical protein